MKKLLGEGDVKVHRIRHKSNTAYYITPDERRRVVMAVGDSAYTLYSHYRTEFFTSSDELKDDAVGEAIGWIGTKVKRYRLELEKAGLFKMVRQGPKAKAEGMTRVWVGEDTVALHNAGLPSEILDGPEFVKLKKQFNVRTVKDLIEKVPMMMAAYEEKCLEETL